jgi:hypothetical protein
MALLTSKFLNVLYRNLTCTTLQNRVMPPHYSLEEIEMIIAAGPSSEPRRRVEVFATPEMKLAKGKLNEASRALYAAKQQATTISKTEKYDLEIQKKFLDDMTNTVLRELSEHGQNSKLVRDQLLSSVAFLGDQRTEVNELIRSQPVHQSPQNPHNRLIAYEPPKQQAATLASSSDGGNGFEDGLKPVEKAREKRRAEENNWGNYQVVKYEPPRPKTSSGVTVLDDGATWFVTTTEKPGEKLIHLKKSKIGNSV